jgi:hypothetical protein
MVEASSRKLFGPHSLPIKDGSPLAARRSSLSAADNDHRARERQRD